MTTKAKTKTTATKTKKASAESAAKKKPAAKKLVAKTATKKPAVKKAAPKKAVAKTSAVKKTAAAKPVKTKPTAPRGIPEQLRDAALKVLDERQGEDILTVDLRGKSPLADYVLIATGKSGRQLAAIADYMREAFLALGVKKIVVEGVAQGDWVLIDAGDIIVHLFRPDVRRYYRIEDIWSKTTTKPAP